MLTYIKASEITPAVTKIPEGFKAHVPFSVPKGQAYYWSPEWQRAEKEADDELRNGKAHRFDNAEDAIRWLDAE